MMSKFALPMDWKRNGWYAKSKQREFETFRFFVNCTI